MKHALISSFLLFFLSAQYALCQSKNNEALAGTWKGTSICQVKNSPCHDEVVVYHITRSKTDSNYAVLANKIVNGVEEEMGTLDFVYNKKQQTLICHYTNPKGQKSIWEFHISGKEMKGKLVLSEGDVLYRIIELKKE